MPRAVLKRSTVMHWMKQPSNIVDVDGRRTIIRPDYPYSANLRRAVSAASYVLAGKAVAVCFVEDRHTWSRRHVTIINDIAYAEPYSGIWPRLVGASAVLLNQAFAVSL